MFLDGVGILPGVAPKVIKNSAEEYGRLRLCYLQVSNPWSSIPCDGAPLPMSGASFRSHMQAPEEFWFGFYEALFSVVITVLIWTAKRLRKAFRDIDYAHQGLRAERRKRIRLQRKVEQLLKR